MSKAVKRGKSTQRKIALTGGGFLLFVVFAVFFTFAFPVKQAQAICCPKDGPPDKKCNQFQCDDSERIIAKKYHPEAEERMVSHQIMEFRVHRFWFTKRFLEEMIAKSLIHYTESLSKLAYHHAAAIGKLFDAKNQLETQRLMEKLKFEASKRYQPSESFCWFGTGVRSLQSAEAKTRFTAQGANETSLSDQLGKKYMASAGSKIEDLSNRWRKYTETYCRTSDNNNGLKMACGSSGDRPNRDLQYTALINNPRTIQADFSTSSLNEDAQDILAMRKNLYGHDVPSRQISSLSTIKAQRSYMKMRSLLAKRSVATSSFNAILALKSEGEQSPVSGNLQAILEGLGAENAAAFDIGEKPSYYAQLEILSKRIFQNPRFYASLYESPENVARKSAALKTIELMLERAIAESETRQEMIMSVLLSSRLQDKISETSKRGQ